MCPRRPKIQAVWSSQCSRTASGSHPIQHGRGACSGYPWSRPEIGLRGLSSRNFLQQIQCSHHEPVEQPEQLDSERRLYRFPDSWFLTTWAEMRVLRVMAPKASVSKILPLLPIANCHIFAMRSSIKRRTESNFPPEPHVVAEIEGVIGLKPIRPCSTVQYSARLAKKNWDSRCM